MGIEITEAIYLYKSGLSLRGVCRKLGISENYKSTLSDLIEQKGIKIRRTGKPKKTIGKYKNGNCPKCGKIKKVKIRKLNQPIKFCGSCATYKSHKDNPRIGRAETHYDWKGGINKNRQGYIVEYVKRNNKFFPMAANTHRAGGYILQHRLIMAKHINRCLIKVEIVHHINGNRADNRIENLNLKHLKEHGTTYQDGFRDGYRRAMLDHNKIWTGKEWEIEK